VAIVTGASRGIGRGAAIAFAEAGADVVIAARSINALEKTAEAVEAAGGRALAVPCDVGQAEDIERCVAAAVETFGGVDIVVNNAQSIDYRLLLDSTDQVMRDALDSGPFAAFRFMRAAHLFLKARRGVIINVGSSAIHLPNSTRYGVYTAAKAAMEALARTAATEWADDGIRAFTLHPTAESVMTQSWKSRDPEGYAALVSKMPRGHLGDPLDDIGRPLVRLVLHADRFNGKTIVLTAMGAAETVETIEDRPFTLP
jgi:NAD(P)-dependent dehydrogenase (short-subunit alcohol dehydrogenase family)